MNVSVFKGSVAKPEPGDAWEAYGVAPLVSAQLLELMERTGVRRFVVYPGDRGDDEEQIDGVLVCFPPHATVVTCLCELLY